MKSTLEIWNEDYPKGSLCYDSPGNETVEPEPQTERDDDEIQEGSQSSEDCLRLHL